MKTPYICLTCGVQFAPSDAPPEHCPICEDERQYVGHNGQQWTTLSDLKKDHQNRIERQEEGLYGIGTDPKFAIGQRALLIQSEQGNVLWDCISVIDEQTVQHVNELGGISAIAISHPHYYGSAVEWAHAFDVPIYLHERDRQWMMRPDPCITFWDGDIYSLNSEVTLICVGGHFAGGTVCYWSGSPSQSGRLLTGDIIQVVADRRWVSFMYSYPNYIPLPAAKVTQIVNKLSGYEFDRIYGAWWTAIVPTDAKSSVARSARRYIQAITHGLS